MVFSTFGEDRARTIERQGCSFLSDRKEAEDREERGANGFRSVAKTGTPIRISRLSIGMERQ